LITKLNFVFKGYRLKTKLLLQEIRKAIAHIVCFQMLEHYHFTKLGGKIHHGLKLNQFLKRKI